MKQHYPYLIIGGGMAADAAARGIRSIDSEQPVGLISSEAHPPYNRPPLSKGLWKPTRPTPFSRVWRNTANLGIDLHLGHTISHIDPEYRQVTDDEGTEYSYEKLLLATGGTPIHISPDHPRVIYYRTLADYYRLRELTETGQKFVVIGGGFIGSEITAALANLGKEVTILFMEEGICARVMPEAISANLNQAYETHGVKVLARQVVASIVPDDTGVTVRTQAGKEIRADAVVAGLGIRPNTALAEEAGLITGNGIHVDEAMRTSQADIFAAGDVINFYSPALHKHMRVEHEENANLSGMIAGQGMAGQPGRYDILPSFYSTLFEHQYDAVGELNPELEIVYDWQEPFQKGVIYYTRGGTVRGVLLWNIKRGLDAARALIDDPGPFAPGDLKGKIRE